MDKGDSFDQHLAVLHKLQIDPAYAIYWKNWKACQSWMNRCDETYLEYQKSVAWQRAQDDLTSLLDSIKTAERKISAAAVADISDNGDIVMEDTEQLSEFYRISMEHKKQRAAERDRQKEEEEKHPKVEYVDAKDVGIHGISSFNIEKKTFGEKAQEHLAETQKKYGPHAEKVITLESTMNYKFDELISKFTPPLWPNIPFRFIMGRKRPVFSSVTETAAGDESPDESERPPPFVMAEESPAKKTRRKSKTKTPESDTGATRTSKRTRKPTTHFDDEEFFNEFRAKNKRRRVKQEIEDEEGKEKQVSESQDEDTVDDMPTTSRKGAASVKEIPTTSKRKEAVQKAPSTHTVTEQVAAKFVTPKNEILEEPDIIPLEHSPPLLQRASISPQFDVSSLYASASSQEKFRKAAASTTNHFANPIVQKQYPPPRPQSNRNFTTQSADTQYPRVILPRTFTVGTGTPATPRFLKHSYQNYLFEQPTPSKPIYKPLIGQYRAPSSSSPLLPQYQDKRIRSIHDNEAVKCPDCNIILKNMYAYNTHRNYVHGQAARGRISCPEYGCLVMSTSMVGLVRHLNAQHRYCLRHEQHIFKNENEYNKWFRSLVEDGYVSFVRSAGGLRSNDEVSGTVSIMFYCNRNGRKSLNNRAGTLKMNAVCPAYFRMTKHQSGYVSVYAQLRHIGHECIPKYKTISSYAPLRNCITDIELGLQSFKDLSKATIPFDYPMDKNSLISSCMEVLTNIKLEFQRAKLLIDGIIPSEQIDDEPFASYDEELFKSSADLDIFALPTPQESGTNNRNGEHQSPVFRFESSPELEDEVEILKNSIYNAFANLKNNSDLASQVSPPPGDIPSPPTHSNDLGPSTSSSSVEKLDTVRNMDEERIKQYRQTPNVLENGRIQCTLCSVILKTFDSYNIHRHTQHGLPTIENSSQQLPDDG